MKKGFTLVELLAVITILGLLILLVAPKIVNMLDDSEINTNKVSAEGIVKAATYKYQNNEMIGATNENIMIDYGKNFNTDYLDYTGNNPESGLVSIRSNGKVALAVKFKDYCYIKKYNEAEINVIPYNESNCGENASVFINYEMPEIVRQGPGLYESSTEPGRYIYRGANPNNYIWLDENGDNTKQAGETYRIISYESDGTIKVIRDASIGSYAWDSRTDTTTGPRHNTNNTYCNYTGTYNGCNVWGNRANTYYKGVSLTNLNQDFYYKYYRSSTSTALENNTNTGTVSQDSSLNTYLNTTWLNANILNNYIDNHDFNVGGIYYHSTYPASEAKTLSQEKAEQNIYTWNGKIGLMNITDYVDASLNSTCTNVYSNFYYNSNYYYDVNGDGTKEQTISGYDNWPCSNRSYNWMAKAIGECSLSPNSNSRSTVWTVSSSGYFNNSSASSTFGVRPVFYLKSQIKLGGFGTSDNPYRIVNS